ncbi:MAG: tetratricopeptide repeat protein, partial [Treponemataceae bacterium]
MILFRNKIFSPFFIFFLFLCFFTSGVFSLSVSQTNPDGFVLSNFISKLNTTISDSGLKEGLELFEVLPENVKTFSQVMYLNSALLLSAGKVHEAKKMGQALLDADPENIDFLLLNSMISKSLGETSIKRNFLSQVVKVDPFNADANTELATDQMAARNYSAAQTLYQKALVKTPNHTQALFGYGKACYYLGDFVSAQNSFENILKINPRDS